MNRSEQLAVIRTNLANERTMLAYLRTFVVIFGGGLAMIQLDALANLRWLGAVLVCTSPAVLVAGLVRFKQVRSKINDPTLVD
jgi:putative membrane protein